MTRPLCAALAIAVLGISPASAKIVGYKFSGVTTTNSVEAGDLTTEFPVGTKWTATVEWESTSAPLFESDTQGQYRLTNFTLNLTGATGVWTTSSKVDQASFTLNYEFGGTRDLIQFTSGWGPTNHTNPVLEDWAPYSINLVLTDPTGTAIPTLTPAPTSLDLSDFSPLVANTHLKIYLNNDANRLIYGSIQSASPIYEPDISVSEGDDDLADGTSKSNFGTVKLGKTARPKLYKITNNGGTKLTKLAVSVSGPNKADFIVGKLAKTSLAPGASTEVEVTFKPKAKGTRKAAFKITSNDTDENPFNIELSGVGKKP
ncbi:MAG: choice-of-anchor D domain-containing protein [Verrucomicrobiota bacterium]